MRRDQTPVESDDRDWKKASVRCSALYVVHPSSVEPVAAVADTGFDVRFELQAEPDLSPVAYEVRLVIKKQGEATSHLDVHPACFTGTINDSIHWSAPANEFIFQVRSGECEVGDTLDIFGVLRLTTAEGTRTLVSHCSPVTVVASTSELSAIGNDPPRPNSPQAGLENIGVSKAGHEASLMAAVPQGIGRVEEKNMQGLELLQDLVAHRDQSARSTGLPAEKLRFIVEYSEAVEVAPTRLEIASVLGVTDGFDFFPLFEDDAPDDEFGVFYVLQFPGLDRTMEDVDLYTMAHDLQAELGASTVEPDVGSTFYQEPLASGSGPEAEGVLGSLFGSVFGPLCRVHDKPPDDRQWALRAVRVLGSDGNPGAWDISDARGAGIVIGQPDTGVTVHEELDTVAAASGRDVLGDDNDATDPLGPGNPGHGTGTASVVVSGDPGHVAGAAPKAGLRPIRCIESVVIRFNAGPVAKAIDWARAETHGGCHIITMSLGGTPSHAVKKACKRAIDEGVIVLAAAGNCVRTVIYPARYPEVIAVTGSNVDDGIWRGSCRGDAVDITAPGENVWKATAGPTGNNVEGGQGTSYAVALTAGVAALWLSHHGRQAVLDEAAKRGVTVQQLFRQAVRATARPASNGLWDTDDFGAGIVDARALLERPLDATSGPVIETATGASVPGQDVVKLIAETLGAEEAARIGPRLNRQFEMEVAAAAFAAAARNGPEVNQGSNLGETEASALASRLSPQLRAQLEGTSSHMVGRAERMTSTGPTIRVADSPNSGPDPAVLVAKSTSGLESAGVASVQEAQAELKARPNDPVDALEAKLDTIGNHLKVNDRARLEELRPDLLANAARVVDLLARGEAVPRVGPAATALEALVALENRPAVPLDDDGVEGESQADLGQWAGSVFIVNPDLAQHQRSVGRIDDTNGHHQGTGFVVAPGLVLTNRHVLQNIGVPVPRRTEPTAWVLSGSPVINFSPRADDPARSFHIEEVVFAGPDPIGGELDVAHLDLALLRVETESAAGALPPTLPVSFNPEKTADGSQIFVVGYPASPAYLPTDSEGGIRNDVVDVLRLIYGLDYGRRYLSPGLVQRPTDSAANGLRNWIFPHDATTLGGNSGSCVLAADGTSDVIGLHIAGDWLRSNYAHDLTALQKTMAAWL